MNMLGLIDSNGNYFQARLNLNGATEVPLRPSEFHSWVNGMWVFSRNIAEVKAEKMVELQQARDKAAAANVKVQGKVFSADPKITDLFAKLADQQRRGKPTKLAAIFTVDGMPVNPVTAALLEQIEDAITANVEAAWNRYGQLVGQVMAATTVDQINKITW